MTFFLCRTIRVVVRKREKNEFGKRLFDSYYILVGFNDAYRLGDLRQCEKVCRVIGPDKGAVGEDRCHTFVDR